MNIELNHYGFVLDTAWCYVALNWKLIALSALVSVGYKFYAKRKGN